MHDLLAEDDTDWTRPPLSRPPAPCADPVAPEPHDDDLALLAPIVDNDLGVVVEALTADKRSPVQIVDAIRRDHGVLVSPVAVERYMVHIAVIRRLRKLGNRPAHPELDAAIRDHHEDLKREAPEDLRRIDRAIGFLDDVVRGDKTALGAAGPDIVLRERVKASKELVNAVGGKYEITKRKILPDDGADAQVDLVTILRGAYGPAVQLQPDAVRDDPLGLLGRKGTVGTDGR